MTLKAVVVNVRVDAYLALCGSCATNLSRVYPAFRPYDNWDGCHRPELDKGEHGWMDVTIFGHSISGELVFYSRMCLCVTESLIETLKSHS